MAESRWQWVPLKEDRVVQQIPRPRPRLCLRLLRGPLPPNTNVATDSDKEETRSQIDHIYKGNR